MHVRFLLLSLWLGFFPIICFAQSETPVDPGLLLYQGFSSKCHSNGPFSSRAFNETQVLQNVMVQIKEDKNCRGLVGLFGSLIDAQQQFAVARWGVGNEKLQDLEAYDRKLTIAYTVATDPAEKSLLQTELANVRLKIQQFEFSQSEDEYLRRADALARLSIYLETVSQSYPEQLNCFEKNPTLPLQLASQLLSISGGFFDPTLGLAIGLAGRLIGTFFDFLSNYDINLKISDYRKTTMRAGLSCAMEALEQTVCDVEDQDRLVQQLSDYRSLPEVSPVWRGYDLFQRDFPIVQTFLAVAESGPDPESKDQGRRQSDFYQKQGNFRASGRVVLGLLADADRDLRLRKGASLSEKQAIVKKLIDSIAREALGSGGSNNAYIQIVPTVPDPFLRLILWLRLRQENPAFGVRADGHHNSDYNELYESLDQPGSPYAESDAVIQLDLDKITATFKEIERRAKANLDLEQMKTVNVDQAGAVATWTRVTQILPDAGVVIQRLITYLSGLEGAWKSHPEWFSSEYARQDQLKVIEDTRSRFEKTLATLYDSNQAPEVRLKEIYQQMELRERDQFITNRLRNIVEQDLILQLKSGLLLRDDQILNSLVRLSTDSLLKSLSPNSNPETRLSAIRADLAGARTTALDNLAHFYKHFDDQIVTALEHLRSMASDTYELPMDDPVWEEYSKICLLALNNPYLNKGDKAAQKISDLCKTRKLAFYRNKQERVPVVDPYGDPLVASFDAQSKLTPSKRLCSYRRYQNRAELYEVLRQRPSPFFENYNRELSPEERKKYFNPYSIADRLKDPSQVEDWYYDSTEKTWKKR